MSERITRTQVDALAVHVTRLLPRDVGVDWHHESGRYVIEQIRPGPRGPITVRTLRAGSLREMYEYLYAMREALLLAQEGCS